MRFHRRQILLTCLSLSIFALLLDNFLCGLVNCGLHAKQNPLVAGSEEKDSFEDKRPLVSGNDDKAAGRSKKSDTGVHLSSNGHPCESSQQNERFEWYTFRSVGCHELDSGCHEYFRWLQNSTVERNAFYYLVRGGNVQQNLLPSLLSIRLYFNQNRLYPVFIFHEFDDLTSDMKNSICSAAKTAVFFFPIEFKPPTFLRTPIKENIDCFSRIGYRHMCRFNARLVHYHPAIKSLIYYWRMDDNSLLLADVPYDVFERMRSTKKLYGYIWKHWDAHQCTKDLWPATRKYIVEHHINTTFFKLWPETQLFYNNFEISSTAVWLSNNYENYIDFIDREEGIYKHRWGDAPIKGIALSLFVPMSQIHHFADISYQHGSFINKGNKSFSK